MALRTDGIELDAERYRLESGLSAAVGGPQVLPDPANSLAGRILLQPARATTQRARRHLQRRTWGPTQPESTVVHG